MSQGAPLEPGAEMRQIPCMHGLFPRLVAAFLALTLLFTAETMALARGAPAPVGEIILCTSHGVMSVPIDAEGNPTEAPHICPDCLTFFAATEPDPFGLAREIRLVPVVLPRLESWRAVALPAARPPARGPPISL